jgi:hypothetical protein
MKIEANRRNALASTGPNTTDGKVVVSRNAIRHGLLSWKPTIPGLESEEDWETHLEMTLESLSPVGHTEILLSERAALLLWRLGRVARYEREVTANGLEREEARQRPKIAEANQAIRAAQARLDLTEGLQKLAPGTKADSKVAAKLLGAAADEAGVDIFDGEGGWPIYVDGLDLDDVNWTAARLLECVQIAAAKGQTTLEELLARLTRDARENLMKARRARRKQLAESARQRRSMLLPEAIILEKVSRYETTLERSLFKVLHELERRQAARAGQAVPLPVAVDVNLCGAAQE